MPAMSQQLPIALEVVYDVEQSLCLCVVWVTPRNASCNYAVYINIFLLFEPIERFLARTDD
jgi:hypothetical protein